MKIRFDSFGNINAASISSENLGGSIVADVADNADLLSNPFKYTYIGNVLARRKYIVLTTTDPVAPADGSSTITLVVTAYNPNGSTDTSANYVVNITDVAPPFKNPSSPLSPITLSSGVGTLTLTASVAKKMNMSASSAGVFGSSLRVEFI